MSKHTPSLTPETARQIDILNDACARISGTLKSGVTYALYPELGVDPLEALEVSIRIASKALEKAKEES